MRCPVCKKDGLLVTIKVCPRCESQITSDYELEDSSDKIQKKEFSLLKGKVVEMAQKKERAEQKNSRLRAYLVMMGLILFSFFLFRKSPAPELIEKESGPVIDGLKQEVQSLQKTNRDLEERISARSSKEIKYVIRKGDNLTQISRLFYNDPNALVKIASQNKIRIPDRIIEGDTLTLLLFN